MNHFIAQLNDTAQILLSVSMILSAGFLATRATKKANLPNVTGYVVAGILIGPHILGLIPINLQNGMGFMSDVALSFIAFGVARFFTKEAFKETGLGIITITLMESILAGILVTLSMRYIFNLEWNLSLILGAIGTATAPASTMVTIRQYKAKGYFVYALLQIVAFDDAVCLVVFSVATALVGTQSGAASVFLPIVYNILAIIPAIAGGFALDALLARRGTSDNRLILTITVLFFITGLCAALDISPLLSCMILGTTYMNISHDNELFKEIDRFAPPILAIFFVISGMNLDIRSFTTLGVIGIAYFFIRIAGKYLGAYLGCLMVGTDKSVRNYLGLALIPQAGVSIGLAFLGRRILPPEMGNMLLTIILSSSVLYELLGPISAKYALIASGAIDRENLRAGRKENLSGSGKTLSSNE